MKNNTSTHPHLAFVFPGQGSQSLGMLKEMAEAFPLVQDIYAVASAVLNYDLWQLVQEGPESVLNQTEKTQPALLAGSVALWQIWLEQRGVLPACMAGHSLGEYSALVCAKALDFQAAIKLVEMRGRFMQAAVPEGQGAMAAIVGLDNQKINHLCEEAAQGEILSPANFNSIGQVVIAGQTAAVNRLINHAKSAGAKIAKLLPMSVPSHCQLMKPAAEKLATYLQTIDIKSPQIPVIQNAEVRSYKNATDIKAALVNQLYLPVRWVETIELFAQDNIQKIIECGPGKVLAGLNKRINDTIENLSINTPQQLQKALENEP